MYAARPHKSRRFIHGHSGSGPSGAGPTHPLWKGEDVSYTGLHHWVESHRPKTGQCQVCGEWRYTEQANLSGEYLRDLDDFMEMCKPCHRRFDAQVA